MCVSEYVCVCVHKNVALLSLNPLRRFVCWNLSLSLQRTVQRRRNRDLRRANVCCTLNFSRPLRLVVARRGGFMLCTLATHPK